MNYNILKNLLSILTIVFFTSCQEKTNTEKNIQIDSSIIQKDSILKEETFAGKPISFYLNHPGIPQAAKDMYNGKVNPNLVEAAFVLPDSLDSQMKDTGPFYFIAVTRSFPKSDGAYSEGLGFWAKEYVELNTIQFLKYFIEEPLLTESDFDFWSRSVGWEISISFEKKEMQGFKEFELALKSNCKKCTEVQEEKLTAFLKRVKGHIKKSINNN